MKPLTIRTGKPGHPRHVNTAAAAIIGPAVIRSLADAGFTIVPTAMLDALTACKVAPPELFTGDTVRENWTASASSSSPFADYYATTRAARADVEERCALDPALTTKPAQPPVGKEEGA